MSVEENKYINKNRSRQDNTYAAEIWNAAIEAAANKVESAGNILLAHSIRELKK